MTMGLVGVGSKLGKNLGSRQVFKNSSLIKSGWVKTWTRIGRGQKPEKIKKLIIFFCLKTEF